MRADRHIIKTHFRNNRFAVFLLQSTLKRKCCINLQGRSLESISFPDFLLSQVNNCAISATYLPNWLHARLPGKRRVEKLSALSPQGLRFEGITGPCNHLFLVSKPNTIFMDAGKKVSFKSSLPTAWWTNCMPP